ncbi:unnamed protein product, partial [Ascophyllum nodosum]
MTTEVITKGEVTIYDFRGLLGTLGYHRRKSIGGAAIPTRRFMVLDHSDLLVYASAEDWTKDSEPQDYIKLSAESTIE